MNCPTADSRLSLFLSACLALLGCGQTAAPPANSAAAGPQAVHAHAEHGPHDGQLIELGEDEYHAELVHDDATDTVTIYLLDRAAKMPVPVEAAELPLNLVVGGSPAQFALTAARLPGEPAGQSSCFKLMDKKLCEALDDKATKGRLNVTIGSKPYTGNIEHHHH
jgi:hypothetical protein